MTAAIVILNAGHGDKGSRYDSGAVHLGYREAPLVRSMFDILGPMLEKDGITVHQIGRGPYAARDATAIRIARDNPGARVVHVLGHINSAERPGRYAAVFHDHRSGGGKAAAVEVASHLGTMAEVDSCMVIAAQSGDWTGRAYSVMRRTYSGPANISAILLETHFINQPRHQALNTPEGLSRIASLVAAGLTDYLIDNPAQT